MRNAFFPGKYFLIPRHSRFFFSVFAVLILILLLTGCGALGFYVQAIRGQCSILAAREPLDRMLTDPETPLALKEKLNRVMDIRGFAEEILKLPVDKNYLTYVDVKSPYVMWAVFAAPEFSIEPEMWCYPIAGCAMYRGYFSREDAEAYAGQLTSRGYDVHIGGVKAYSTLGWFDDPVLNTFLDQGETRLAALIFHETAHSIFYVKDDTPFNEGFARTVEQEGLRRWFFAGNNPGAYAQYLRSVIRHKEFAKLISKYRQTLSSLYNSHLPEDEKRMQKNRLFDRLGNDYISLKKKWNGFSGYDPWFRKDLNNAKLASVSVYNDYVPAFLNMLEQEKGDLEKFYRRCLVLADLPKEEREATLRQTMDDNIGR